MIEDELARALKQLDKRVTPALSAEVPRMGTGTAFPTGVTVGYRFFRTDLGFECYYDGTRWLTVQVLEARWTNTTYSATADDFATLNCVAADYQMYPVRWDAYVTVGATNTGAVFWTIRLRDTATNSLASFNTSGQTPSTELLYVVAIPTFTLPTIRQYINLRTEKTGAPTNMSMYGVLRYRLIIP